MKKLILSAALLAVATMPIAAQDFSFSEGDITTEVQVNPFGNDYDMFKISGLQGRYFFNDDTAIRLGLGLEVNTNKTTPSEDNKDVWSKGSTGMFSINLGLEKHFANYGRLDLYYGGELAFAHSWAKKIEQKVVNDKKQETTYQNEFEGQRAETRFGINVFTGIDFFVYKGLYVGTELGLEFAYSIKPATYTKGGYDDHNNWSESKESDKVNKANGFNLGTFIKPALRLGWKF